METNPITDNDRIPDARTVYWDTPNLYVYRLRLLSDPGFPVWDVSYCYGYIKNEDGSVKEKVRVSLPFDQLPKKHMKRHIVDYAKTDGVYAKELGILDNISTLC